MRTASQKWPAIFRPAEFLSAVYLLRCSMGISVLYLVVHLAGLRELTTVLNGTVGSMTLGWENSEWLAMVYIIIYLAFVILAPVLVLAAGILTMWQRWQRKSCL